MRIGAVAALGVARLVVLLLGVAAYTLLLPHSVSAQPAVTPKSGVGIPEPPLPSGEWKRLRFNVARAASPPKIDGNLDDPCWATASRAVGFYRFGGSSPVVEQTEAWFAADNDYLYVAFHCLDSQPGQIRTSETQRGGNVDGDDHVAVEVDSQNTRRGLSVFSVSANGTQSEELEGGTASNITWAGDWKAATKRTSDGWTAEMAIPFRLLRYPKGAKTFGIFLWRRMARETNPTVWPYIPPVGQNFGSKNQFLDDFDGLAPRYYAPRPTFLPYLLATGGSASSVRQGLDIKYPISTTMTGVAALSPDFQTVEQDVAGINFSYNEQFVDDRRPFFAEGRDFFPSPELFYSRRIEKVDEGIKVAGKSGATSLGLLYANHRQGENGRDSVALNFGQDIGALSHAGFALVTDNHVGSPANRVGQVYGQYAVQRGAYRYGTFGSYARSMVGGKNTGGMGGFGLRVDGGNGQPHFRLGYDGVGTNFESDLGLVPEQNRRGVTMSAFQFNAFDRGPIEFYNVFVGVSRHNHEDGSFFHDSGNVGVYAQTRRGYGFFGGWDVGRRQENLTGPRFNDHTVEGGFSWNQRTLFQRGGVNSSIGRQAGEAYRFLSAEQSFLLSRSFTLNTSFSRQNLGSDITSQLIVTGTYRLDGLRTLSGRLIRQDGNGDPAQSVGVPRGTNLYLAYSQRSRRGADIFLLLGDPNANVTRAQITLKIARPY